MSKKQTTKPATFAVEDRVIVSTASTLGQPAAGVVEATTKTGWFVIRLDDPAAFPSAKDGKVSARASSLQHEQQAVPDHRASAGSTLGMLQAANGKPEKPAKTPKAPKAKPAPKALPTVCPECGGHLKHEGDSCRDEDGNILLECADPECGWEDTIEPDHDAASRMAEALRKARAHYTKDKRPDGSATAHCGDAIAKELHDLEPVEVANLADKVLQAEPGFHAAKYGSLNNGQIRMNSGNRIRGYWKRINEEGNEAEILRVAKLLNLVEVDDAEEAGE